MATASARGWLRSTVQTLALVIMVSAAGCSCALPIPQMVSTTRIVERQHAEPLPYRRQQDEWSRGRPANLPLSPMQFGAENVEKLMSVFLAHQFHSILGQFALHPIAAFDGNAHLSIHGQKAFFLSDGNHDSNSRM